MSEKMSFFGNVKNKAMNMLIPGVAVSADKDVFYYKYFPQATEDESLLKVVRYFDYGLPILYNKFGKDYIRKFMQTLCWLDSYEPNKDENVRSANIYRPLLYTEKNHSSEVFYDLFLTHLKEYNISGDIELVMNLTNYYMMLKDFKSSKVSYSSSGLMEVNSSAFLKYSKYGQVSKFLQEVHGITYDRQLAVDAFNSHKHLINAPKLAIVDGDIVEL